MARIYKNSGPGGNFSGKVGNVVYRQCGDIVVVCAAPSTFNVSQSDAAVSDRQRFGLVNSLVKGINQVHVLRTGWLGSSVNGRRIGNKITHINKPRMAANPDLANLMLIPAEEYFPVELDSFADEETIGSVTYTINIKPLVNAGIKTFDIETVSLQGVACCSEPNTDNTKQFFFAPLFPSLKPLDPNSTTEFRIILQGKDFLLTKKYNKRSLLLNLLTYNRNLQPAEASVNIHILLE